MSVPSQLVEQRPDIRAAEEELHAASAQVGIATANLLPSFTINANAGFMSTALAHLLAPQNLFWTLAGNATQTIFDAGTLLHLLAGAKDTYNAAAWTYRGTVIGAVQNVADSLRALQNDADALRAARDFERAAKISFDLARQQMQTGNANVLLLLTAQQTYLQAVIQVVQARAARLADTVALFQALGGGWWNRIEPPAEKILDVGTGEATTVLEEFRRPLKAPDGSSSPTVARWPAARDDRRRRRRGRRYDADHRVKTGGEHAALVFHVEFEAFAEKHRRATGRHAVLRCEAQRRPLQQEDAAGSPLRRAHHPEPVFVSSNEEQRDRCAEHARIGTRRKFDYRCRTGSCELVLIAGNEGHAAQWRARGYRVAPAASS